MCVIVLLFCLIIHVSFNESHAAMIDSLIDRVLDLKMGVYIQDGLIGGAITKVLTEIDWPQMLNKLDSAAGIVPEKSLTSIMQDEESSHY